MEKNNKSYFVNSFNLLYFYFFWSSKLEGADVGTSLKLLVVCTILRCFFYQSNFILNSRLHEIETVCEKIKFESL